MKYIYEPKTIAEARDNVTFQFANVEGWLCVDKYEAALIKAQCLVKDLETIIKMEKAETVVLFGDANNPEVVASKKRLELIGRTVEIQPEAGQPLGPCGQPCTCTELCKSMKYENI